MGIILASLLALGLTILSVLIHYEAFTHVSRLAQWMNLARRRRLLVIIFGALAAHTAEISAYGLAFWVLHGFSPLGEIVGNVEGGAIDFLYFSISNYTTLGVGDIRAEGPMRLIASSEALTGLVMLSWTASFTYLSMEDFWRNGGSNGTHEP